jgi:hypothetical protein
MYDEKLFSLDISTKPDNISVITEAVFKDGKEKVKPIEDAFNNLSRVYSEKKKNLTGSGSSMRGHNEFYTDPAWKNLEKAIIECLGIRSVIFSHMTIKSRVKNKPYLNCYTYTNMYDRFPIDGLITDKGFYDSSHTLMCEMIISQELFDTCTAEEITAIFLHELGHNIDPALVDIKYTGTDILIDSMLGREVSDKKIDKAKPKGLEGFGVFILIYWLIVLLLTILPAFIAFIKDLFESKEKKLKKIKKLLEVAKEFNKKENTEAYADNIARMYGYGAALMAGLKKVGIQNEDIYLHSFKEKSKRREKAVLNMYIWALEDVHGTDVQRTVALIKEYEADLKDDTIPDSAKKWIKKDKEQLEALLDAYINNKDELKATVNRMIKDAMSDDSPDEGKK